jgi:hypothetical protein
VFFWFTRIYYFILFSFHFFYFLNIFQLWLIFDI